MKIYSINQLKIFIVTLLVSLTFSNSFAQCSITNTVDTWAYPTNVPVGQSFTASCNGDLEYVELETISPGALSGTFQIYAGDGFSGSQIYSQAYNLNGTTRVILTNALALTSGNQYTFRYTSVNSPGNSLGPEYHNSNPYAGGKAYESSSIVGAGEYDWAFEISMTAPCNVNIPDANFKAYLLGEATININGDTEIQCSEASAFSGTMDCSNQSISDLTGIEAFTSLTNLTCNDNQLINLNITQNTALLVLNCSNNLLSNIDLSQNTLIYDLRCANNQLTNLNLSQNSNLYVLLCSGNLITSLDFTLNPVLDALACDSNQLTSLDISQNPNVRYLTCSSNSLTTLNLKNGNYTNFYAHDFRYNSNLYCIEVDNAAWSNSNWTYKDAIVTYSEISCSCTINIPDANFNAFLLADNSINPNGDTEIQCYEAAAYNGVINCSNQSIADLTGIEAFVNITQLNCSGNSLTSLDLSQNTALVDFNGSNNQLTSLNIVNGINLSMTQFLVTTNPNLLCITVDDDSWSASNWTNVDPVAGFSTNCSACLVYIPDVDFRNYLLGNLSINSNSDMQIQCSEAANFSGRISCDWMNIYSLDGIETFVNLTELECQGNQISNLDLTQNVDLEFLNCRSNQLTTLDVSQNTDLEHLHCFNNQITSLDLSQNLNLFNLNCEGNQITSLDLSQNTWLYSLDCRNNQLTSLNLANGVNPNINSIDAKFNPNLSCIEIDAGFTPTFSWEKDATASWSTNCNVPPCFINIPDANFKTYLLGNSAINTNGNTEIECAEASAFSGTINCVSSSITDLTGIEAFTSITELNCGFNSLSVLDLSQNTALTILTCRNNMLTSLDLSQNTSLLEVHCFVNQLTSINLSQNTLLTNLNCNSNQLANLNVSQNLALTHLYCNYNNITSLDLTTNTSIIEFWADNNDFTSINVANGNNNNMTLMDVRFNPNLTCIQHDTGFNPASNGSWLKDASASWSTNCSVVLVNSINVQGQGGVSTITTNGGSLQMVATVFPSNATDATYTWSVINGSGSASISTSGLLTASSNGTVNVIATANDASGVSGSTTINISNQGTPIVLVNSITVQGLGGVSTITTNGGTLQMQATVLPANADNVTYTWSVTNGTGSASISTSGILTASANGTVNVIATANDASGISGSATITISNQGTSIVLVNSITVDGQGGASTITTSGGSLQMEAVVLPANADDVTYTWSVVNGTGSASISSSGLLTASADGTVEVTATAGDASGVFGTKTISISNQTVGINELAFENLNVYPNPTSDFINLELTEGLTSIRIMDLSGKTVKVFDANVKQLNIAEFTSGIYFLEVANAESKSVIKIIKK